MVPVYGPVPAQTKAHMNKNTILVRDIGDDIQQEHSHRLAGQWRDTGVQPGIMLWHMGSGGLLLGRGR